MISYVTAFAIATVAAALLTPIVRRLALRIGAVSGTGGRNMHATAVPRLGGVAIGIALFLPIVGIMFVKSEVGSLIQRAPRMIIGLCGGGLAMAALGAVDDTRGVRALHKLVVQVLVAVFAFALGFRILSVQLPLFGTISMGIFALPVTVMWIVGIINAVNLIDGLDGLAAGVVFFAGFANLTVAVMGGHHFTALIMASMMGAILGFLFYNFNPARIFMGDSGSYLLGYVIGASALVGAAQKTSTTVSLLVPILALGVPIFDTLLAIVRRFLERRPVFAPDRRHIHHRLLDMGITHRRAVLILYGVSMVFTIAALGVYLGRSWQIGLALLTVSCVLAGLVRFVGYFSHVQFRRRSSARIRSRETELLRRSLPALPAKFEEARTEQEILKLLVTIAKDNPIVHLSLARKGATPADDAVVAWDEEATQRSVVATMIYPIGEDALARSFMEVSIVNDFEDTTMAPATDILLQVIADMTAQALLRVGSELGPISHAERTSVSRISSPLLGASGSTSVEVL